MIDSPSIQSLNAKTMEPWLIVCDDVSKGTHHMRQKGKIYLPKEEGEEECDYKNRLDRSTIYPAFRCTVRSLSGMAIRKGVEIPKEIPDEMKVHFDSIDGSGTGFVELVSQLFMECIGRGMSIILVDYPKEDPEIKTEADRLKSGRRPYWSVYKASQYVSHRLKIIAGRQVLEQLVLKEEIQTTNGIFGEETVTQYRVLRPGEFEIWRPVEQNGQVSFEKIKEESGKTSLDEIPAVVCYGEKMGPLLARPPLLDLAYLNIEHYQKRSDQSNLLHIGSVPILTMLGFDKSDVQRVSVGPARALVHHNPNAKVGYTEVSGNAYAAIRENIKDLETHMASLGLSILAAKFDNQRTAREASIHEGQQTSDLREISISVNSAIKEASRIHAKWMGFDLESFPSLNIDLSSVMLDPQVIAHLSRMVEAGQLSLETMWETLQQGEILPDGFDSEVEKERIADFVNQALPDPVERGQKVE